MEREEKMQVIGKFVEDVIHQCGGNKEQRGRISVAYDTLTEEAVAGFTDFQRDWFGLFPGEECFLIRDEREFSDLLYVVNVTGDSIIAAASELWELAAMKF